MGAGPGLGGEADVIQLVVVAFGLVVEERNCACLGIAAERQDFVHQ
jgi:hypothetical protein